MIQATIGELYDRCVRSYANETAILFQDQRISYREMGARALSLLAGLQGLGLKRGDRVALLMANCPEYLYCEYALAKGGMVRVPLAVLLGNEDHIYMMNLTECETLIYHERFRDRVLAMAPQLTHVQRFICVGETLPKGHLSLESLLAQEHAQPKAETIESEDLAAIYFTGGTTGKPKGVMLSHRSWTYTYLMELLDFGIDWQDRFVFPTPLTHAGGCLILPVLLRGGSCIILDHFEPQLLLGAIAEHHATATLLVPTMIYMLLDSPYLDQYDLSSLKNVLYGASIIAPERLKQAVDTFGPIFTQFFGQTEAPMTMTVLPRHMHRHSDPERERKIHASAGRPCLHTQLRLLDEEGKEVGVGESGEVVVRCANTMLGYYKNPEATAATLRDGWLYTGDIAYQDEEGLLYIVDRKKDMIITGGFNVFPREVEDVLFEHPTVKQAAVVGVPHPKWGEEVRAIVVLQAGHEPDEQALIDFVKQRKGSLMAPKRVEFWDSIPVTNLGKVDKKHIRALCQ